MNNKFVLCPRCHKYFSVNAFYKQGNLSDKHYRICKDCRVKSQKAYYHKNKEHCRLITQKHNDKLKVEVFTHYSNGIPRCAICGETDMMVLCLDHIDGKGNQLRKELNLVGGLQYYRWLRLNKFPGGYQILCANCNLRKETLRVRSGIK
jgi:hypothetical protein